LLRSCATLPEAAAIAPVAWRAERMTLTASVTGIAGPVYDELAAWPFAASP
jgi:2'-5' RNA ligase